MIMYKSCLEVNKDLIYQAFVNGFSDYIVKLSMTEMQFFDRFFGPEGNGLKHSYVAIENSKGVGLVLGGIREFDGLKTMRCGTMCVSPNLRGKGLSKKLFELHKKAAIQENCKQLFLEVITSNDRAIKFYENNGYLKAYDLVYYSTDNLSWLDNLTFDKVEEIEIKELRDFRNEFSGTHINWQNEIDFIEKTKSKNYGIKDKDKVIAAISINNGVIRFIGVKEQFRNKGMASMLIKAGISSETSEIHIGFSNNSNLEGYFRKIGFKKDAISQYEMYLPI